MGQRYGPGQRRGGSRGAPRRGSSGAPSDDRPARERGDLGALEEELHRIDGRGYPAYKDVKGRWASEGLTVVVDHVQGDPFAAPSKVRLILDEDLHQLPAELTEPGARRVAVCDQILRVFAKALRGAVDRDVASRSGSGSSGKVSVDVGDAEILERAGCAIVNGKLELRFRVGLPARGRRVLGRAAADLLCRTLPGAAPQVVWPALDQAAVRGVALLVEDHLHLQGVLEERGLVSFLRDESVLPRHTGVSSAPLADAVKLIAPDTLRVTLPTLHHGEVTGLGVPEGVTLITGGGFHGKTTLLEAIQTGVYPHIPGDGREWVVTRSDAMKVRSEDGRSVAGVDLSWFISDLPRGKDTGSFSTQDASGSTSLAAALVESVEAGSCALLLDEDTSATNLLIRDARMQELVQRETITPLIDRVRSLSADNGASTLLVVGGSGDYLDVADTVILMEEYLPHDVTERAREVAKARPTERASSPSAAALPQAARCPAPRSFDARRGFKEKVRARGLKELEFGEDTVDLSGLEQLVDHSQVRAVGALLRRMQKLADGKTPLVDLVRAALEDARGEGMYALERSPELALPRALEVASAANRLRGLRIAEGEPPNATAGEVGGEGDGDHGR